MHHYIHICRQGSVRFRETTLSIHESIFRLINQSRVISKYFFQLLWQICKIRVPNFTKVNRHIRRQESVIIREPTLSKHKLIVFHPINQDRETFKYFLELSLKICKIRVPNLTKVNRPLLYTNLSTGVGQNPRNYPK